MNQVQCTSIAEHQMRLQDITGELRLQNLTRNNRDGNSRKNHDVLVGFHLFYEINCYCYYMVLFFIEDLWTGGSVL